MRRIFAPRNSFISVHLRSINARLAEIERQIRRLDSFVANPRPRKHRDDVTVTRLLGSTILPESKKRFVSYLSTGSFQTIGLRRHEQKAAKIKAALIILLIILAAFFVIYTFLSPLMH